MPEKSVAPACLRALKNMQQKETMHACDAFRTFTTGYCAIRAICVRTDQLEILVPYLGKLVHLAESLVKITHEVGSAEEKTALIRQSSSAGSYPMLVANSAKALHVSSFSST